jgi:hypothetical protein
MPVAAGLLLLVSGLVGGCFADQSRTAREDITDAERFEEDRRLHGTAGREINAVFASDHFREVMDVMRGEGHGLQLVAFHYIQVAKDPTRPMDLSIVGYVRELREERDSMRLYEIFDQEWSLLAILDGRGNLFHVATGEEKHLGRHQLEGAAFMLFDPPGGYGSDRLAQDQAAVRMWDPEVRAAQPRDRGVFHRGHSDAPPVLLVTEVRAEAIGDLAERFNRERADEQHNLRLQAMREARRGDVGEDEFFGGLEWRGGNPVDEHGNPMRRGSIRPE